MGETRLPAELRFVRVGATRNRVLSVIRYLTLM